LLGFVLALKHAGTWGKEQRSIGRKFLFFFIYSLVPFSLFPPICGSEFKELFVRHLTRMRRIETDATEPVRKATLKQSGVNAARKYRSQVSTSNSQTFLDIPQWPARAHPVRSGWLANVRWLQHLGCPPKA